MEQTNAVLVRQWWAEIHNMTAEFMSLIDASPTAVSSDQDIQTTKTRIMGQYTHLDRIAIPEDAKNTHGALQRAMFHLAMSYQSVQQNEWDQSDTFYARALADWQAARLGLQRLGLLRRVA